MLNGRDVSNYQGNYTWPGGLQFGFAKATEGTFFKDATFAHNWNELWSKKMLRGAYHFGHPGTSAIAQAQYFVNYVKAHGLETNDALALDLEVNDGLTASAVAAWARAFVAEVKHLTGKNVIVYTMLSYVRGGYCAGLQAQPLWIAYPNSSPGSVPSVSPWPTWTFHQYGTVSGIDADVLNGDAVTWAKIVNVSAPKPPPLPKPPTPKPIPTITKVTVYFSDGSSKSL